MKKVAVNEAFRAWTRGVSFTLTMGKSQVALLVAMHYSIKSNWWVSDSHPALAHAYVGARGLIDRGLAKAADHYSCRSRGTCYEHNRVVCRLCTPIDKIKDTWSITEAGEYVVSLLKISGVYQELVKEFLKHDNRTKMRLVS